MGMLGLINGMIFDSFKKTIFVGFLIILAFLAGVLTQW